MTLQSCIGFAQVSADNVPAPAAGSPTRYRFFVADGSVATLSPGTPTTTAGHLYRIDSARNLVDVVASVTAFNGRGGAVTPIQADYDAFFLTPAEGNAAYDAIGAAAAAQAASQPLDSDLTAIAALTTTSFGRSLLTFASTAVLTASIALASNALAGQVSGAMSGADKLAMDNVNNTNLDRNGSNKRRFRLGEYGAIDQTGSASSNAAWLAMWTAVNALNDRCIVELPVGVFKVDTNVAALTSSAPVEIVGPGRGICVLIPISATGDMLKFAAGVDGCSAHDFAIYQTSGTPQSSGAAVNTNGADDVRISDMLFVDQFYDVNVNGTSIKVSIQRTVHSQTNGNANSVGVIVTNGLAGDTYIGPDVVMSNTGATRRRASVEIVQSGHFEVNQCNLTGSAQGMLCDPGAGQIVADGFINTSLFDSCTVNGVTLNAGTATSTIKSIYFNNSWYAGTITGGGSGFKSTGTAGGIINGICHNGCRALNNQTHGFEHGFGTDFEWANCRSSGNSAASANASDGWNIAAAVSNWKIVGGKSGGTDGAPTGGNQRWGVNILAGASNNYAVVLVDLTGNTTGAISDNGTGVMKQIGPNIGGALLGGVTNTVAASAAINTTETVISSGVSLPAGSLNPGSEFEIDISGTCTSTVANLSTFTIRLGTGNVVGDTSICTVAFTASATGTGVAFKLRIKFVVRTVGAAGTFYCDGIVWQTAAGGLIGGTNAVAVAALVTAPNTTNNNFLNISYKSAATTTTTTFQSVSMRQVKS